MGLWGVHLGSTSIFGFGSRVRFLDPILKIFIILSLIKIFLILMKKSKLFENSYKKIFLKILT